MKSRHAAGKLCVLLTAAAFLALLHSNLAAEYEADVCVYGGTSGGVIAAVQAARMGKSVVLVVFNNHLGGMSSGGLGWTDFGNKDSIQGLSREYYIRIRQKYMPSSVEPQWTWEPKVAEEVFNDFVEESDIPVYWNQRLASAQMDGERIVSITMEDGNVFKAKMFIDCTYEGDLMAKAGVSYTVGREPNSQYGETINGIQAGLTGNQLPNGIDPYVVPGDPSSGLLPGVNPDAGGANGEGDDRVQAYNYRMCLTNQSSNRVMVQQPQGYDDTDYEILFRAIEAGQTGRFWKTDAMPNNKTDSNNASGISTDFIGGGSERWAEATYEEREEIARAHEKWQRGLIWTVQNHPRVPSTIRSNWSQWGLPADEFLDTNHWPHQIYVREARRMVSDYVMTQLNCTGARVAPESVGLASYMMDSHHVQRIVQNGMVKNEGDVQVKFSSPYPISYRSIIPATGECENLFVTFAISASHMGFGSCRMEPVMMMTSQSAATAAAFAIDDDVSVQEVSYPKLKAQMLADGQMPDWNPSSPSNGVVVDNTDTDRVELTGEWLTSSASPGYHGVDYLHDDNTGKGQKSVRYRPALTSTANHEVFGRWTAHSNRATNVPIDIHHAGGTTTVTVDQRNTGGTWISLGTYPFNQGTTGSVVVRTTGTNGYVIADAFEFIGPSALTVSIWAVNASASEPFGGGPPGIGRMMLSRTGATSSSLTVQLSFQGTATNGIDCTAIPASITFPAGVSFVSLDVTPLEDADVEGEETAIVSLESGAGYVIDPDLASATMRMADRTLLDAPAGLSGTMVDGAVRLAWMSVPGAGSYSVKRSESSHGPFGTVASNLASPPWSQSGLPLDAAYFYVVSATNEAGDEGPNSAPVHIFDQYVAWLVAQGKTPGVEGSDFQDDPDGTGQSNGFKYAIPKGLKLTPGPTSVALEAEVRQDPAITAILLRSSNLADWTPAVWMPASDQTGVDAGFQRLMHEDIEDPDIPAQFYRIELSR